MAAPSYRNPDPDRPAPARPVDPYESTVLHGVDIDDVMQYLTHLRTEHLDGAHPIAGCMHCHMKVLSWVAAGILDVNELSAAGVSDDPAPQTPETQQHPADGHLLDVADAMQYLTHLRTEHLDDGAYPPIAGCRHCHMKVLSWVAAGIIDINEVSAAGDDPAPQTPETQQHPAGGDLLDIVDADGQMLCGCGCRTPITDRSPSAYFATQECSERWHERRVHANPPAPPTGPAPRPPAVTPTGQEPATWWLGQLSPQIAEPAVITYRTTHAGGLLVHIEIPSAAITHDPDLEPLLHTRRCFMCGLRTPPKTNHGDVDASIEVTIDDISQQCGTCGSDLPGRPLFGRVERLAGSQIRLHLENGTAAAHTTLSVHPQTRTLRPNPHTLVRARCAWDRLELDLHRFGTYWQPSTGTPAPGDDRPYFMDVPPPPRVRPILPWRGGSR
jgi:hypothetical protein